MHASGQTALLLAIATTFVAGIVRGFSGFGGAIIQAPIFALIYSPVEAVATISALGALAALQLLPGAIRVSHGRELIPLSCAALLCLPLGGMALMALDAAVMRRVISAFVILLVVLLMLGVRYPGKPNTWSSIGAGIFSGTINGATGVGGPPVVLYFLAGPNSAAVNRANLIVYYSVLNGGNVLSLLWQGAFTPSLIWRALVLWPVQVGAVWFGSWLFRRVNDAIYRKLALALMLGVGIFGLLYRK